MPDDAPGPSVVRMNAERDGSYCPYCHGCKSFARMEIVERFYWRCAACGAEHDERAPAPDAPAARVTAQPLSAQDMPEVDCCPMCASVGIDKVQERTKGRWGDRPEVEFDDEVWRCVDCGEEWYDPHMANRHTLQLLKATLAAAEARAVRCEADDRLEPIKYRVRGVPSRIEHGEAIGMHVEIEQRLQRDGAKLWAVTDNGYVLNVSGEWEYEPIPSSRTDAFIARTRFASVREALDTLAARR